MMAGLGGALAGLSAMYGGYKQGEMDEFKIDDAKRGELAKVAMGNALKMLGAGPQGQGGGGLPQMGGQPPGMPPGQPSQPMQQPSPVGGQGLPGPGGMPPRPGMGMPSGGPSQGPGGMPQMGGPPQMPPPGAGGPGGMSGGLPPGMGGPSPQGMQQPGGRQLDWRQLVQAVQQSNPNIKPDVLAEAVNQFLPMMNAQSQQEWRQVSLQIREQALQQREQQFMLADQTRRSEGAANRENRKDIVGEQIGSREKIAGENIGSREKIAEENIGSREKIADKRLTEADLARTGRESLATRRLDQQQTQFSTREKRLQESLDLRSDTTWERLEQQKQAAIDRAASNQWKQGAADVKTLIDAQDKHVRAKISASNILSASQRKVMLEEADKVNAEQLASLRTRFKGREAGGAASPADSSIPPEAVKALKEGQVTTFENGQKWTLKGGK